LFSVEIQKGILAWVDWGSPPRVSVLIANFHITKLWKIYPRNVLLHWREIR
jgi:hypothetical protein